MSRLGTIAVAGNVGREIDTQNEFDFYHCSSTMSIKVRYFASLKEIAGGSDQLLEVAEPITAREVWYLCLNGKTTPDNVLVAINMNYAEWDSLVSDGDEIAFFPPVTGG